MWGSYISMTPYKTFPFLSNLHRRKHKIFVIRQCKCGKFLGKNDKVHCNKCGIEMRKQVKEDFNLIKTFVRIHTYISIREFIGMSIPVKLCRNIGLR